MTTPITFSHDTENDCWNSVGITPQVQIDRNGIAIASGSLIPWKSLDIYRSSVGGQYPIPCTSPDGHYFTYHSDECQHCRKTQLDVYGAWQMAEWDKQKQEHAEFTRKCRLILQHLLRRDTWTVELQWHGPANHLLTLVHATEPADDYVSISPGHDIFYRPNNRPAMSLEVPSDLVKRFEYLLKGEQPAPKVFSFGEARQTVAAAPKQKSALRRLAGWFGCE